MYHIKLCICNAEYLKAILKPVCTTWSCLDHNVMVMGAKVISVCTTWSCLNYNAVRTIIKIYVPLKTIYIQWEL